MIEIDSIGTVIYDWCNMVLNGAEVTIVDKNGDNVLLDGSQILQQPFNPAIPLVPSHRNEAGRDDLHIVIPYTPESESTNGIDPINLGVDSNYVDGIDPGELYSVATDITEGTVIMEMREVHGSGKLLKILEKLQDHWMVKMYFDSFSMSFCGKEGALISVPFETNESTHRESVASFKFGFMDGITYNLGYIAEVSGDYEVYDAEGTTVAEGSYDTENETGE